MVAAWLVSSGRKHRICGLVVLGTSAVSLPFAYYGKTSLGVDLAVQKLPSLSRMKFKWRWAQESERVVESDEEESDDNAHLHAVGEDLLEVYTGNESVANFVENGACKEGKHALLPNDAAYCNAKCPRSKHTICPTGPKCDFTSAALQKLGLDWLVRSAEATPIPSLELTRSRPYGTPENPRFRKAVDEVSGLSKHLSTTPRLLPKMLGRCALVGNGGVLDHLAQGREIDTFERVIRINLGPVTGYETKVGQRIDVDIVNGMHFTYEMLRHPSNRKWWKRFVQNSKTKLIIYFAYKARSLRSYKKIRESFPKLNIVLANYPNIRYLYEARCHQMRKVNWGNWDSKALKTESSRSRCYGGFDIGSLAVQLAAELCESVSLFGFFPFEANWLTGVKVPYHYWPFDGKKSKTLGKPRLNQERGSIGFEMQLAMACISRWRCIVEPSLVVCREYGFSSSLGNTTMAAHVRTHERKEGADQWKYHVDMIF